MFLMNSSPLVALPRKWEPFAPSRSCRYPVCFSESEDDIARTTVSAKVQVIINNLQSEDASLGSHSEYGCIMQKKQKGAKGRVPRLRGSSRVLQKHIKYPQHNCPADSDGMEVEEGSEFGPLLLNSDSDDSVDRDIEEAIQEYLKNKGQTLRPLPSPTRSLDGDKRVPQKHPSHEAACHLFPAGVEAGAVQQHLAPGYLGEDAVPWASSPCSVSSDDSFEQSIKAEIEQFLNEKKQQAKKKNITGGNRRLEQRETQEELAVGSRKDGTSRASQRSLKRGGKVLFLRRPPELQASNAPKCLKSKANEELADCRTTSQAHFIAPLAGHSCALEQSKGGEKRPTLWKGRGEQRLGSRDVSDSSSDDGIEEAIQLYQLEKTRKAADSRTDCLPFQKEEFRAGGVGDLSASLANHSVKSALEEIPRKALSSKRKHVGPKPAELPRVGGICLNLEKSRSRSPPGNSFAKCAVTFQASCRADTATELMCAEAILDISKTILPLPPGSENGTDARSPSFCSQDVPPSQHESDTNAVDSDDSIEQEIRAFLAVKAQTEHLIAKPKEASCSIRSPSCSGQSDEPSWDATRPFCKPLKVPLSRKRKLKGGSKTSRLSQNVQAILSETSYSCVDNNRSTTSASLEEDGVNRLENGEAGGMAKCQQGALATVSSVDFANPLSQGLFGSGKLVKSTSQSQQKYRAGDKSSSLDSDEDLDTAIKDLLRSKRKLKKKSKDQRIPCKKRVRFGNTEMHIFEAEGRECKSKTPALLKSCLVSSRRDVEEEEEEEEEEEAEKKELQGKPKGAKTIQFAFEFKKECQAKPTCGPEIQEAAENNQCLWTATSLTDDSSSVDSDDSIEQEIQRFLAEKAKDSTSTMELSGADEIVKTLRVDNPQTALCKAKCPLFQGGSNVLLKPNKKGKMAVLPIVKLKSSLRAEGEMAGNASRNGEQTLPCTEETCSRALARTQANRGIVQAKGVGLPVKRTAVGRKVTYDQRGLPPGKDKGESRTLQNHFKPVSLFKRKSSYEFRMSSKLIAGLKSAPNKKKSVIWGERQSIEFALFKSPGGVCAADLLGERCDASVQEGIPGSRKETGVREAGLSSTYATEGLHLCMSERNGEKQVTTLPNEGVNVAQIKPWGDKEPCYCVAPDPSPPLQERRIDDVRGVKASTGLLPVGTPVRAEEGRTQEHSSSKNPNSACNSPPKERPLFGQDKIAEEASPKRFMGGSTEFPDVPVGEYLHCPVKSKVSALQVFPQF
ncbi:protein phosphatase 1 regulatory subunit 26 [Elgaria multicarinata webbii]|uniref:protein phosphatase 1 regulatory subunit 26 n=1 Tax=Elgaria multicarinata webbii TaxID=159646 RepID=UPI002FCD0E89